MSNLNLSGDGHILRAIKVSADELQNNMLDPMRMRNTFKLAEMNILSKYLKSDLRETALFVAVYVSCCNEGTIGLKEIADFFGCTPFELLSYHKQLQSLIDKRIVIEQRDSSCAASSGIAFCNSTFGISITASFNILSDKPIVVENQDNYDIYDFIEDIDKLRDTHLSSKELCDKVEKLEEQHPLDSIKRLKELVPSTIDRCLYYSIVNDYTSDILIDNEYTALRPNLRFICDTNHDMVRVFITIKDRINPLVTEGLITIDRGTYSTAKVKLTLKGKRMLLEEDAEAFFTTKGEQNTNIYMVEPEKIKQKELFFDGKTDEAYKALVKGLNEDNFRNMQKKLSERNMPIGITAIFYGSPGTGKTEMAYQIAKATGRNVIPVDISATKSKWFGESEQIIKEVFDNYRLACSHGKPKPILLFNEADGVLSKRINLDRGTSCTQTLNAIQNIILEEMERFNGILIATTNLENNLDKAFERRFLYKIRFEKPSEAVKIKIWKSKMPNLTDDNALTLARNYDFSGGEIDNIVRKAITREITECLDETSFEDIVSFCESERFENRHRTQIGFRV